VERELAPLDGVAKVARELDNRRAVPIGAWLVHRAIRVGALGHVHGDVRVAHERVNVVAVVRRERDADARLDEQRVAPDHNGRGQARADALAHVHRLAHVGDLREEDRELVAAEPRDRVGGAHGHPQTDRDLTKQVVAHGMAERVVHFLEAVEVGEEQGERRPVASRREQRLLDTVLEERAVREAGERVVQRLMRERLLGAHALRDVA